MSCNETESERCEVEKDAEKSNSTEVKESDWFAILYNPEWHIGEISKKNIDDDDDLEIAFLRRANSTTCNATNILFKWPFQEDILFVNRSDIIYKLAMDPTPVGRSGRSFELNEHDIRSVTALFNVM